MSSLPWSTVIIDVYTISSVLRGQQQYVSFYVTLYETTILMTVQPVLRGHLRDKEKSGLLRQVTS
jgi:hypothetical protein